MRKNDLKREKAFRRGLEREFHVDAPPASYFQAVQDALDSLPVELPVKARPLHQRVLRACAGMAAALALVCAGAFGLNLANPLLMESMPGVGALFQELNRRDGESHLPLPTPEPQDPSSVLEQEVEPAVPAFEGVTLHDEVFGIGQLTVRDAWSDGLYLHLDLLLDLWGDYPMNHEALLLYPTPGLDEGSPNSLTVDGQLVELREGNFLNHANFYFQADTADGRQYAAEFVFKLPQQAEHLQELAVELNINTLYTLGDNGDGSYPELGCGFFGSFPVTVDAASTLTWDTPLEDNGVRLERVEASSTCVNAYVRVPDFGNLNSTMTMPLELMLDPEKELPLGLYGALATPDGERVDKLGNGRYLEEGVYRLEDVEYSKVKASEYGSGSVYSGGLSFSGVPKGQRQLVLTLYEYNVEPAEAKENRVAAEFTIDLARGTVYASENYLAQGREKLDYAASRQEDRTPTPENGYICAVPDMTGNAIELTLYTQDLEYRSTTLYWYNGSEIMSMYPSVPSSEYNQNAEAADGYAFPYYQGEYHDYGEVGIDPALTQGKSYKAVTFILKNTWSARQVLYSEDTRFVLVDNETSQVLVADLLENYERAIDEVLNGGGQGAGSQAEASSPGASPLPEDETVE